MITMTSKGKRKTFVAAPGAVPIHNRRCRWPVGKRGRRSGYHYAVAAFLVMALGVTWALGVVGCTPTVGSNRLQETSGIFFSNGGLSALETSRILRNVHYYKLMGRPDLALKELEQAYQRNPDNIKLVNTLAQVYEEMGQFDSARKLYQEALTKQSHPALANNLCFTYYLEGRFQEAETCFRQTLARDPGNEAARNNLGLLYCRLDRQDEARRLWQEAEGTAAAEYKTRQVLAALGKADQPVYARGDNAAPASVAAMASSPPEASQKVAMRLPPSPPPEKPSPNLTESVNEIQEEPAPLKAAPAASPAVPEESDHIAPGPKTNPGTVELADLPRPPPAAPGPLQSPAASGAPSKPPLESAPQPALEKPVPVTHQTLDQGQPKAGAEQAKPSPGPYAKPRSSPAYPTGSELVNTAIEVRNGTRAPHLAREVRSFLTQEAFTVTKIGNHVNFGAPKTLIYYQPEARRVAQALQREIFPMAGLKQSGQLRNKVSIKVVLGNDLLKNQDLMARLHGAEAQPEVTNTAPPEADQHLTALATVAPPAQATNAQAQPRAKAAPPQTPAPGNQTPGPLASKPLTAPELMYSAIEVLNGTRTTRLAHRTRTLLKLEGFTVARIGNYRDFGAEKTIIYYRPEAQKVARVLSQTLFPGAGMEPSTKLRNNIAIQILLGADLLERPQLLARLALEKP